MVVFSSGIHPILGPDLITIHTATATNGEFQNLNVVNLTSQNSILNTATSTGLTCTGSIQTQPLAVLGSATINNLTTTGTTTFVNSTDLNIQDKIITLGKTSSSTVPSNHTSGLEFDRGTTLSKYNLIYQESDQTIRAGLVNDTLPLMIRDNIPLNLGFFIWDSANYKAVTKSASESRSLLDIFSKSEVNNALALKSNTDHNHHDMYYTETETNNLLSGKSNTDHNHDSRYYIKSETDNLLSSKSSITHTHVSSDIVEGTKLFYTDARARASISAGSGISYNSSTGVITNTYTIPTNPVFDTLTVNGYSSFIKQIRGGYEWNLTGFNDGYTEYFHINLNNENLMKIKNVGHIHLPKSNSILRTAYVSVQKGITYTGSIGVNDTNYYDSNGGGSPWFNAKTTINGEYLTTNCWGSSGERHLMTCNINTGDIALGEERTPPVQIYLQGNVGIGTTSPTQRLDVNGNIKCDNLYSNNNVRGGFGVISFVLNATNTSIPNFINAMYPSGFSFHSDNFSDGGTHKQHTLNFNIPSWAPTPFGNWINNNQIPSLANVLNDSFSSEFNTNIRTECKILPSRLIELKIYTLIIQPSGERVGAMLGSSVIINVPLLFC